MRRLPSEGGPGDLGVTSVLLVVADKGRLRAFHPTIMDPQEQRFLERLADRMVRRADDLARSDLLSSSLPDPLPDLLLDLVLAPLTSCAEVARTSGYSGDACRSCGSLRVRRTGTCLTCEDCASNEGCG